MRRTVGSTEIVVQQFNALSGVASLNMTLFDSKSIPGLNSANALQKSAVAAAAETRRQLSFEVSQAFLATLGVGQLLEASRHRHDFAKQNLDAAGARYAAGLASVNDVTLAELEAATAEVGVTQNEGQVQTSTLQLGFLLDAPPALTKTLVVPEFLIQAAQGEAADTEKLVAEAQGRRLDLASLRWLAKSQHALAPSSNSHRSMFARLKAKSANSNVASFEANSCEESFGPIHWRNSPSRSSNVPRLR